MPNIYRDNLEDFASKHPRVVRHFQKHDQALSELGNAVESTFQRLVGPSGKSVRKVFADAVNKLEGNKEIGEQAFDYIAGHFASGIHRLSDQFDFHKTYNESTVLRGAVDQACSAEQSSTRDAARRLHAATRDLHDNLVSIRTRLADQYGARIRPVDPDAIGY